MHARQALCHWPTYTRPLFAFACFLFCFVSKRGLAMQPKLASNSLSPYLHHPRTWITLCATMPQLTGFFEANNRQGDNASLTNGHKHGSLQMYTCAWLVQIRRLVEMAIPLWLLFQHAGTGMGSGQSLELSLTQRTHQSVSPIHSHPVSGCLLQKHLCF